MRASARKRAARAARFAAPAPCEVAEGEAPRASPKAVRAARKEAKKRRTGGSGGGDDNDGDEAAKPELGRCEILEKPYLRLTGPVDWSKIRPPRVLKESLELVKTRWKEENDYNYAISQLKSIRQDLTVQRCAESDRWLLLCTRVYETHARIALESADLDEMHQCLSVLEDLHARGARSERQREACTKFSNEFAAYRILHAIHTENNLFLNTARELAARKKDSVAIAHAFAVLSAIRQNAFVQFFLLHDAAPNMSGFLMDHMLARVRRRAFEVLLKSSFPELDLKVVQGQLRFHEGRKRADGDMMKFLGEYKLVYLYATSSKKKRYPRAIDVQALKKANKVALRA